MNVREEGRFVWLFGALFTIAALFVWVTMKLLPEQLMPYQTFLVIGLIVLMSAAFTLLLHRYVYAIHALERKNAKPLEEAMWDQTLLVKGLTRRIDSFQNTKDIVVYRLCAGLTGPLKRLQWNMDTLMHASDVTLPPPQTRALHEIWDVGQIIARSITKLVSLLDIQEGRGKIHPDKVDPVALVRAVYTAHRDTMGHKGLTFKLVMAKRTFPHLMMDRERIRECLEFLLENARNYTAQGGLVTLGMLAGKKGIRFYVMDTGIGISKEIQGRIWEKFFRSASAAELTPEGTGAGLPIVKYYVEAHGGSVGFRSQVGKGSTFWIDLPLPTRKRNP